MLRSTSKSQVFVHQKNHLSFSYPKSKLTKENLHQYIDSQTREEYRPMIQQDPSVYLHIVKDGIYYMDSGKIHTYCSSEQLNRVYHQSDSVYYFLMRNLRLNVFCKQEDQWRQEKIQYVCSTFYPEDILEMNLDYYKISFKESHRPLYLHPNTKLFDESGHRKSILDVVHRMGRRRILGMDDTHRFQTFDIEKVENITSDEENISVLDTPFYSIGIVRDEQRDKDRNMRGSILMNRILVELD